MGACAHHGAVWASNAILKIASRRVVWYEDPDAIKPPFLLVANHVSHFDPPLLSGALPTAVDWMADAPLFKHGWSRAFFVAVRAFPVDRARPDRAALKTALERLQAGRAVGMFPEGGIRDGERSVLGGAGLKSGFAAIAQLAKVPLLPCVILGSDRVYNRRWWTGLRRAPVWVGSGRLLKPDYSMPRDMVREEIVRTVEDSFRSLLGKMREIFPIRDEDLPQSPQERMREP